MTFDRDPGASPGDLAADKYAALQYSARTLEIYPACVAVYETHCAERGLVAVPGRKKVVREFLTELPHRGATVAIYARAIAWAHVQAGHASPTEDPTVKQTVAAAKARSGAPRLGPAVGIEDVRAALGALDPELPVEARDGAFILLAFASGVPAGTLMRAERSRTKIDEHGVLLALPGGDHFVAAGSTPRTCPAWWTAQWLRHIGPGPGPLFVATNRRGGWSRRPLSRTTGLDVLSRAWQRAGISGPRPSSRRLRRGFAAAAIRVASPVVVAYQLRAKSMRILRDGLHLSGIPRNDHWGMRRGRARRDSGPGR